MRPHTFSSIANGFRTRWRIVGNQIIFSRMVISPNGLFNYDQWDGYLANRNRTLANIYDNNINNNILLAGDSHASWVSDLVWLGERQYDPASGAGSVGVEFAGSAVSSPSPLGQNVSMEVADMSADLLTAMNPELQWQDLFYRGYFELSVGYDVVDAQFFGIPELRTRNGYEMSLANFTVKAGENRLHRYGAAVTPSGKVESGSLQRGTKAGTNLTFDTVSGRYFVFGQS